MPNPAVRAALWDFGGVMTESSFVAFRRFEQARGLPANFLRAINTRIPDGNAWAPLRAFRTHRNSAHANPNRVFSSWCARSSASLLNMPFI
jgi:hypothetical protein